MVCRVTWPVFSTSNSSYNASIDESDKHGETAIDMLASFSSSMDMLLTHTEASKGSGVPAKEHLPQPRATVVPTLVPVPTA